ncbi:dihydroorotate dehydrogenase [Annulohypoxylon stygium]|nr:dihydroorotate dehydrogenase [Annulohypoxylon stygium]
MALPPPLNISPPLLNSANPWATTLEDLTALFECPATGAVTTRTSLIMGFPHDPNKHQYSFFDPGTNIPAGQVSTSGEDGSGTASLNNLGYSPIPLDKYLEFIETIVREKAGGVGNKEKGFIVSVTGPPSHVANCYVRIARAQERVGTKVWLAMEVNLSCPNIEGAPPPAYASGALGMYLEAVGRAAEEWGEREGGGKGVPWGVKTPPYTHAGQFDMFVSGLLGAAEKRGGKCPVSLVTAVNTLGSCLVLDSGDLEGDGGGKVKPRLAGTGIGGMAGAPLHPLALGNVKTLREMLDAMPETRHIQIIGVGGVGDADGYRRMRDVGAAFVGVGTALGRKGVGVFEEIEKGLGGKW